jgi:hypothetical protein
MSPTLAFGFVGPQDITILLFVLLLLALPTAFWIIELVDAARRQFPDQAVKIVWLVVIFFTHFVGALAYYFVGKKQGVLPSA